MAKYKIGDRVRLVSKKPEIFFSFGEGEDKYLGKEFIVWNVINQWKGETVYFLEQILSEDCPHRRIDIAVAERWISGYAEEREREPCTVEIRFDGMTTTATLKRGGRDVKSTEARCNPKDTYSRGEGAKIAVERLFEKKKPVANIEEKFVITKESPFHCFKRGQIVRLVHRDGCISRYKDEKGTLQYVPDAHVRPYKETSK